MATDNIRYWDADCFIGWLAQESDKVDECQGVIRAGEAGEVRIVTSSLTLAEVIKLKRRTPLPSERQQEITAFFEHQYIIVRQLDRRTAERARDLIWNHNLDPKDAIHVATALQGHIARMDTFDNDLIKRSGKVGGNPPLVIGRPDVPEQLAMPTDPADQDDE